MTIQHVSKQDWQLFFLNRRNGIQDRKLITRVLAHVTVCPECRELYQKAIDLSRAANAYAAAVNTQEESGYAAVAAFSSETDKTSEAGSFSVEIDAEDGQAVFLADTVEATGSARQYAVNPEKEGTCLREDEEAFTLTLTGMRLTIRVEPDLEGSVRASLRCYDREQTLAFRGGEASAELSGDDIYILELSFD